LNKRDEKRGDENVYRRDSLRRTPMWFKYEFAHQMESHYSSSLGKEWCDAATKGVGALDSEQHVGCWPGSIVKVISVHHHHSKSTKRLRHCEKMLFLCDVLSCTTVLLLRMISVSLGKAVIGCGRALLRQILDDFLRLS
jgi:hypothetical protein